MQPIESSLYTKVPGTKDFTPGLILGLAKTQASRMIQDADEPWVDTLLEALEGAIRYTHQNFPSPDLELVSIGEFPTFIVGSDQATYAASLLAWSESLNVS